MGGKRRGIIQTTAMTLLLIPVVLTVISGIIGSFGLQRPYLDYLMPRELALFTLVGAVLLVVGAPRGRWRRHTAILCAAWLLCFLLSQLLIVLSGWMPGQSGVANVLIRFLLLTYDGVLLLLLAQGLRLRRLRD